MTNQKFDILLTEDESSFDLAVAQEIIAIANSILSVKDNFNMAISGGTTPLGAFKVLATKKDNLDWKKVNLFWVDERCVMPDSKDSNFFNAFNAFIQYLPVNYFRIISELDPAVAARAYEEKLKEKIPLSNGIPCFDLIILGMGSDGHTGSLFPDTDILSEKEAFVKDVWVEKLKSFRISFTYPLIKTAANRCILIKGEDKKQIMNDIQVSEDSKYPIQGIYPSQSKDKWIVL